jgi:hypothetical protein
MASLYTILKTFRPRRTILSEDFNANNVAVKTAIDTLGEAPLAGRLGVSTPFSVGDASQNYHAVNKGQLDAATVGFTGQFVVNADLTVVSAVSMDIHMRGLTGNRTITLPQNPANGQLVRVRDADHTAATWRITLGRNTRTINGAASDISINVAGAMVTVVYDLANTNWVISDITNCRDEA